AGLGAGSDFEAVQRRGDHQPPPLSLVFATIQRCAIVLIANPKLYLTAHDKDGRLLFDGEVDTPEQKDKVPRDLWEKVEPLLGKMNASPAAEAGAKASH
ncbi:MAG: hypothetical protein ACREIC_28695, partial [Limisphaerales bacterium]